MKHPYLISALLAAASLMVSAQTNIGGLTTITGVSVDKANDKIPIWDASANITKGMTIDQLVNVPSMFASVPDGSFSIADTSGLQTALNDKVDDSQLSTTGGAGKVLQLDNDGNVITGAFTYVPPGSENYSNIATGGVIKLPDRRALQWMNKAGNAANFQIYHWQDHDAYGGETIFQSAWRMAFVAPGPIQFGSNEVLRSAQFLHMTSGAPSVSDPLRSSKAISMQTMTLTPAETVTNAGSFVVGQSYKIASVGTTSFTGIGASSNTVGVRFTATGAGSGTGTAYLLTAGANHIQWQATPADDSGTNPVLRFYHNAEVTGGGGGYSATNGNIVGTQMMEIGKNATKVPGLQLTNTGITFADSTTLTSASVIPTVRAGTTSLAAGTRTVSDSSVTAYTTITLTRKSAGGTIGDLTYSLNPGVGFTITSASNTDTSRVAYQLFEGIILNLTPPSIAGATEIGETLTVTDNEATGSRQWFSNGVAVSGQTGATYVIRAADIGMPIKCQVGGIDSNAVTAWHPDDEPGYTAFFSADQNVYDTVGGSGGNLVTSHGAQVAEWRDLSGNGNHIANSTSNLQPTLDLTSEAGYPNLLFDGNSSHSDFLFRNYDTPQSGGPQTLPQTAYVVAKTISVGANRRLFSTGVAGQRLLLTPDGASDILNYPATTAGDPPADNNLFPHGQRSIITGRCTTTTSYVKVDSGDEFSASATNVVGQGLWVGAANSTSGVNGRVYSALFYRANHDAAQQARVRKYLKAKWGTP